MWYSISQEICTRFLLCCALLWLNIDWFSHIYYWGLLHWHCGNLTIAPVPAKQPWWIWINTSCEFIMNDCITTTKQSTTKPCAYFLGYTVCDTTQHYPWPLLCVTIPLHLRRHKNNLNRYSGSFTPKQSIKINGFIYVIVSPRNGFMHMAVVLLCFVVVV